MDQITAHILMVRPAQFSYNAETAKNNAFQTKDALASSDSVRQKAIEEFDALVELLRSRAINIFVWQDTPTPSKPDAVFPNNWVSFHADGTIVFYPMFASSRRIERSEDLIDALTENFSVRKRLNLDQYEQSNKFLEGTGSMILDRKNEICYACLSPRTNIQLLDEFCKLLHFKRMSFEGIDKNDTPIYHTNVMMALGETFVVICLAAVRFSENRVELLKLFEKTGKEVIDISFEQMNHFAGNMLQVKNNFGETFLVMSSQAFNSLNAQQIAHLNRHTTILHSNISTIEKYGGGSVRCMIAEVFLPTK